VFGEGIWDDGRVSNLILTLVAFASAAFCMSSRNVVCSPEYLASLYAESVRTF
jgi:hypothetical protein